MIQLKEQLASRKGVFEMNSLYLDSFGSVIECRGWKEFCKPPNATVMTIVYKFFANAKEMTGTIYMVRERQVWFDAGSINALLKIDHVMAT